MVQIRCRGGPRTLTRASGRCGAETGSGFSTLLFLRATGLASPGDGSSPLLSSWVQASQPCGRSEIECCDACRTAPTSSRRKAPSTAHAIARRVLPSDVELICTGLLTARPTEVLRRYHKNSTDAAAKKEIFVKYDPRTWPRVRYASSRTAAGFGARARLRGCPDAHAIPR